MKKIISRALLIGCICSVVALSCVLVSVETVREKDRKNMESSYKSSFYTLVDSSQNMETDLSKLMVAEDNEESLSIIADTYAHAQSALSSINGLPTSTENDHTCYRFFNQVCDWSSNYIKSTAQGKGGSFKKQAKQLYLTAKEVNENLERLAENIEGRSIYSLSQDIVPSGIGLDFTLSSTSIDYPSLIYDGAFSDAKENKEGITKGKRKFSYEEVVALAEKTFSMTNIEKVGESDENGGLYSLSGQVNGNEAFVTVTKNGGYVKTYVRTGENGGQISEDEAKRSGKQILSALGYHEMQAVWTNTVDEVYYINYAPVIDGVIYYTSLIKAKITTGGELVALECSGYISEFERENLRATVSEEVAKKKARDIEIKSVDLAI